MLSWAASAVITELPLSLQGVYLKRRNKKGTLKIQQKRNTTFSTFLADKGAQKRLSYCLLYRLYSVFCMNSKKIQDRSLIGLLKILDMSL